MHFPNFVVMVSVFFATIAFAVPGTEGVVIEAIEERVSVKYMHRFRFVVTDECLAEQRK